ncbi:MAG TPA: cytochrome c-type biogenesis protein CcmH [Leucothrix mucor]|nr:cytochrome c-type biogenesis protein CcmH [Leucothrix mucor]
MSISAGLLAGSIETYSFDNPKQGAIYKQLIEELRCLVCQNQNIAGSNAELAQDLRRQTYEMVMKGASRDEVVDFMVTRYGDFVMYRPPFKVKTLLLWVGPPLFLLISLIFLVNYMRKKPQAAEVILDKKQRDSVRDLLK